LARPLEVGLSAVPLGDWRKTRSRIARTSRLDPGADLSDLRQQLKAERLAEHVAAAVASAPPLTPDQRARIAALLGGVG
jgi:hypothetical protein